MNDRISTRAHVEETVGVAAVEESVLKRSGLAGIDYVDHFEIHPVDAAAATPEQWARALFGDVPDAAERFIWRGVLRLHLSEGRSRLTVGGWRISERGDCWVRLETESKALSANLIVAVDGSTLSLTTLVRYDRISGRLIWTVLSAVHRMLIPRMLRSVTKTLALRSPAASRSR